MRADHRLVVGDDHPQRAHRGTVASSANPPFRAAARGERAAEQLDPLAQAPQAATRAGRGELGGPAPAVRGRVPHGHRDLLGSAPHRDGHRRGRGVLVDVRQSLLHHPVDGPGDRRRQVRDVVEPLGVQREPGGAGRREQLLETARRRARRATGVRARFPPGLRAPVRAGVRAHPRGGRQRTGRAGPPVRVGLARRPEHADHLAQLVQRGHPGRAQRRGRVPGRRVGRGHLQRPGLQHHQRHPVADHVVHLRGQAGALLGPGPLGQQVLLAVAALGAFTQVGEVLPADLQEPPGQCRHGRGEQAERDGAPGRRPRPDRDDGQHPDQQPRQPPAAQLHQDEHDRGGGRGQHRVPGEHRRGHQQPRRDQLRAGEQHGAAEHHPGSPRSGTARPTAAPGRRRPGPPARRTGPPRRTCARRPRRPARPGRGTAWSRRRPARRRCGSATGPAPARWPGRRPGGTAPPRCIPTTSRGAGGG